MKRNRSVILSIILGSMLIINSHATEEKNNINIQDKVSINCEGDECNQTEAGSAYIDENHDAHEADSTEEPINNTDTLAIDEESENSIESKKDEMIQEQEVVNHEANIENKSEDIDEEPILAKTNTKKRWWQFWKKSDKTKI
jgi:hypothetical protein